MKKLKFKGRHYNRTTQKEELALEVSKYAKNMAASFVVQYNMPYDCIEELGQEFCLLFFDKVFPNTGIRCDYSTYFNQSIRNTMYNILKSNNKKFKFGIKTLSEEIAKQFASENPIGTGDKNEESNED